MLLVRTRLSQSRIHGIGLFADEPITKDTIIWRFDPRIDIRISPEQLEALSWPAQEQMRRYSYREKHSGLYVLCGDDARFFNHSDTPNCIDLYDGVDADITIALRDIEPGEELTCDYSMFDLDLIEGRYQIGGTAEPGTSLEM